MRVLARMPEVQHLDEAPTRREIQHTFDKLEPIGVNDILDVITQRFVAPIESLGGGHAFLIDDEYNVLWAPDQALFGKNLMEEGEGFPEFQQIVESMSAGSSGTAEYSYFKLDDSTGKYARDEKEESLIAYASIHLGNEL